MSGFRTWLDEITSNYWSEQSTNVKIFIDNKNPHGDWQDFWEGSRWPPCLVALHIGKQIFQPIFDYKETPSTLVYRIDVQDEINVKVGKFLKNIKHAGQNRRAGGKFFSKSINLQTQIRPYRGDFFLKINKCACTSIRYTKVAVFALAHSKINQIA